MTKHFVSSATTLLLLAVAALIISGCASGGGGGDDDGLYRDASGNRVYSRYSTLTVTSSENVLTTHGITSNGPTETVLLIETATDVANASASAHVDLTASFIDANDPAIRGGFINSAGELVNKLRVETNRNGRAEVRFQAPVQPVNTLLIYSQMVEQTSLTTTTTISVVSGPISYTNSGITADSGSCRLLPNDASLATTESVAEIVVYVVDANGNAVSDLERVTLEVTDGVLADADNHKQELLDFIAYQQNPTSSRWYELEPGGTEPVLHAPTIIGALSRSLSIDLINGRGTAKFVAPDDSSITEVVFNIPEDSRLPTLTLPITNTGVANTPNSIRMLNTESASIYVSGTDGVTSTVISVLVRDSGGYAIDETALYHNPSLNNLRLTIYNGPSGGEYLTGRDANMQAVSSYNQASHSIDVRTTDGHADFTLHSGTLPGPIELRAEVLYMQDGAPQNPPVYVSLPQHIILSGAPETLNISWPSGEDAIEDLGNGFYSRIGYVSVTDSLGHAVSDGTSVALNITDTVITEGTTSSVVNSLVTDSSRTVVSDGVGSPTGTETFDTAFVRRVVHDEFFKHMITPGSLITLPNVSESTMRFRYINTIGTTTLATSTPFDTALNAVAYRISKATLGTRVDGVTTSGLTAGAAQTVDGIAEFHVIYPVSDLLNYGKFLNTDTRFTPASSTRVQLTANIAQNNLELVNSAEFVFSPRLPLQLQFEDTTQSEVAVNSLPASVFYTLNLLDASANRVPFETVVTAFNIEDSAPTWTASSNTWNTTSSCFADNDAELTDYDRVPSATSQSDCENVRHGFIWDAAESKCSNPYYVTETSCIDGDFGIWVEDGTCSDPAYTTQDTCLAGSCSNPVYTTQETCEAGHGSDLHVVVNGSTQLTSSGQVTIQVDITGTTSIPNDEVGVRFSYHDTSVESKIIIRR